MKHISWTADGGWKYLDKNGVEITDGCTIQTEDGNAKKVYLTDDGYLGTDATNPKWIEMGRAVECQFGVYPLTEEGCERCMVVRA